MKKAS